MSLELSILFPVLTLVFNVLPVICEILRIDLTQLES
jgi:hypothetical protein